MIVLQVSLKLVASNYISVSNVGMPLGVPINLRLRTTGLVQCPLAAELVMPTQ